MASFCFLFSLKIIFSAISVCVRACCGLHGPQLFCFVALDTGMSCVMCALALALLLSPFLSFSCYCCSMSWLYDMCTQYLAILYKRIYGPTFTLTTKLYKITFKTYSILSEFYLVSRFLLGHSIVVFVVPFFLGADQFLWALSIITGKWNVRYENWVFVERQINRIFLFQ